MPANQNVRNLLPVQNYKLIWSNVLYNITTNLKADSVSVFRTISVANTPWTDADYKDIAINTLLHF